MRTRTKTLKTSSTNSTKAKDWKQFVIMLCQLGSTNKSSEIATVINKHGFEVTSGQVAAVKANYVMGKYNS